MYYPLFVNLKNKKILIIGGGMVGTRRAVYLLKAGASVTVISKNFNKKLLSTNNKNLKLIKKDISKLKINFKDYFLSIIATNDRKTNEKITDKIKNKTLVCRTDSYKLGNVIFPAVSEMKNIRIAYTSFGKDPTLIKKIKKMIQDET